MVLVGPRRLQQGREELWKAQVDNDTRQIRGELESSRVECGRKSVREGEQRVQRLRGWNKLSFFQEPKEEAPGLQQMEGEVVRGVSTEIFQASGGTWDVVWRPGKGTEQFQQGSNTIWCLWFCN